MIKIADEWSLPNFKNFATPEDYERIAELYHTKELSTYQVFQLLPKMAVHKLKKSILFKTTYTGASYLSLLPQEK